MTATGRPRAAVYTRISGQSDDRRYSLETQAEACIEKAKALGYECGEADVFEDHWTGEELHRPAITDLRSRAKAGEYKAIVFYELDRLSRNQAHIYILLDECERRGINLEGVRDTLDSSPLGKLVMSIKAFVAEIEREKIRDRCERGKNRKMASGKILGSGTPRYGYRIDAEASRYIRDEKTGPVVERIFQMVGTEKMSLRKTISVLAADGVPAPGARRKNGHGDGATWLVSTLSDMIRDPIYLGVYSWGKTRTNGFRRNGRLISWPTAETEWTRLPDGCAQPIIDEDLWRAANATVDSRNQDRSRNETSPLLLRGHIFCEVCGSKMVCKTTRAGHGGKIHRYYVCASKDRSHCAANPADVKERCSGRNVSCEFIHEAVWQKLVAIKSEPDQLRAKFEAALAGSNGESLKASLASLEREAAKRDHLVGVLRSKWAEAIQGDDPDFAAVIEVQLKSSIVDAKKLHHACDEIASQITDAEGAAKSIRDLESKIANSKAFLRAATFQQKRDLIEGLGVRVIASGKDFTVEIEMFAGAQCSSYTELRNDKLFRLDVTACSVSGRDSRGVG